MIRFTNNHYTNDADWSPKLAIAVEDAVPLPNHKLQSYPHCRLLTFLWLQSQVVFAALPQLCLLGRAVIVAQLLSRNVCDDFGGAQRGDATDDVQCQLGGAETALCCLGLC